MAGLLITHYEGMEVVADHIYDPAREEHIMAGQISESIPDIERAAATILAHARIAHPVLHAWVRHIIGDPAYAEAMGAFYPPVDPAAALPGYDEPDPDDPADAPQALPQLPVRGRHGREDWNDLFYDLRAFPEPPADAAASVHADRLATALADRATYALAMAVVSFRWAGRPAGEQTHALSGGIALTTSLAAEVAEFARDYAAAWENAFAHLQHDAGLPGYPLARSGAYARYPGLRQPQEATR